MNAKELLDQLLQSGQSLAQKGKELAERGLGIPESGPEREQMINGLGKGAAVGGVLALLLGTRTGRRLAGPLLKIGGVAALGALGYSAYRKWQAGQGSSESFGTSINELAPEKAQARSLTLLRAMIAAANADGHIDDSERNAILSRMGGLTLASDHQIMLAKEIEKPLSVEELAKLSDSKSTATEVYLTSLILVDDESAEERSYLNRLAEALGLPWELVKQLEAEASAT